MGQTPLFSRVFLVVLYSVFAISPVHNEADVGVGHATPLTDGEISRVVAQNEFVLVLFVQKDGGCSECDVASQTIDEINTPGVEKYITMSEDDAEKFAIPDLPSLIYFRDQQPVLYVGDFGDPKTISQWMTSVASHLTVSITTDTFHDHIAKSLVFFHKADCPVDISSVMEAVAQQLKDSVTVGQVNLKMEPRLEQPLSIDSCPQVLFFREGAIVRYMQTGFSVNSIVEFVEKSLEVPSEQTTETVAEVPKRSLWNKVTDAVTIGLLVPLFDLHIAVKVALILTILALATIAVVLSLKKKTKQPSSDHFHFE